MRSGYDIENRMVFNVCSNCGTLNYFDEETHKVYYHTKCYHCNELVEVPDAEEVLIEDEFYRLQKETHPLLRERYAEQHRNFAKTKAKIILS